jgi:mono/diheme cytochrome c family protein
MPRLSLLLLIAACGPEPATAPSAPVVDEAVPRRLLGPVSPSGTLAASLDLRHVWVAEPAEDVVHTFAVDGDAVASSPLVGEPTRLARAGDTLFFTLRTTGELAVFDVTDPRAPLETGRVHLGAEPFDVVATDEGQRVWVSLSQEDAVVVVDTNTLEVVDRHAVPGEPRWMVATTEGRVFVGSARTPTVTMLDPAREPETRPLAAVPRYQHADCPERDLAARITGDLVLSDNERYLFVPALYADTKLVEDPVERPDDEPGDTDVPEEPPGLDDPSCPEFDPPPDAPNPIDPELLAYYAPPVPQDEGAKPGRFNPVISRFTVPVYRPPSDLHTAPDDPAVGEWSLARNTSLAVGATHQPTARSEAVAARGVLTSITLLPDGVWAAMPTMDAVVRVSPHSARDESSGAFTAPYRDAHPIAARGPSAVLRLDRRLVVWSFLERRLAIQRPDAQRFPNRPLPLTSQAAPPSRLPDAVQWGRSLFWSSHDALVATPGSGAACINCHADGRSDGLTWQFPDFPRQTPSLAGSVSATAPLTWAGGVATVVDEIHATSRNRMGGTGLSAEAADALAAYVEWTRPVVLPEVDPALVAHGAEVFEAAGCGLCHLGEARTDKQTHALGDGPALDTPTLLGIAATAPYFHDGRAKTLREVLELSRDGSMGDTSGLDEAEMAALEAYLRSL